MRLPPRDQVVGEGRTRLTPEGDAACAGRRMARRRRLHQAIACVVIGVVAVSLSANAQGPAPDSATGASSGDMTLAAVPPIPPGARPSRWQAYVEWYSAEPDWSPQGRLRRDSGFRSVPDGFGFFNTGRPDWINHDIFGTPLSGPANLDADTLRSMMGPGVCVEGRMSGPCTLTLAARQWMRSANATMSGGHCFGLAATAQQIYQGDLRAGRFQSGARTSYDLTLRTPISRQIARDMAAQFTLGVAQFTMGPRRALVTLINRLTRGRVPLILAMWFGVGGHAVTPYAVRSRGEGRYDIAVYDNNYPGFARAVRVDTRSGTARYHLMDSTSGRPITNVRSLALIPVDKVAARQPCPFCPGAVGTMVQLHPVVSDAPIRTRITDLTGNRIPGVRVIRPLEPWRHGSRWVFPSFEVPAGEAFVVSIDARRRADAVSTTMTATSGEFVIGVADARVAAGTVGQVGVDPRQGAVVYRSAQPELDTVRFIDTGSVGSTQVRARRMTGPASGISGRMNEASRVVSLSTVDGKAARVEVIARHVSPGPSGIPVMLRERVSADVPAGGRILIDYSGWNADRPDDLRIYVLSRGASVISGGASRLLGESTPSSPSLRAVTRTRRSIDPTNSL